MRLVSTCVMAESALYAGRFAPRASTAHWQTRDLCDRFFSIAVGQISSREKNPIISWRIWRQKPMLYAPRVSYP